MQELYFVTYLVAAHSQGISHGAFKYLEGDKSSNRPYCQTNLVVVLN